MFAVFHLGVFKDWWINQKDDKGWINRTIASMGWLKEDVTVIWFDQRPANETPYSFDAQKRIVRYEPAVGQRPKLDEQGEVIEGEFESFNYFKPLTPIAGEVWFENGTLVTSEVAE